MELIKINDTYINLETIAAIKIVHYRQRSKPYHIIIHTGSGTVEEELTYDEGKRLEALLKAFADHI